MVDFRSNKLKKIRPGDHEDMNRGGAVLRNGLS